MKIRVPKLDKKLLSNTFFLYLLTFSTQLLNLVTIPYLTRVLGPVMYGKVGVALGYMTYVTIIMDFGFILSATEKVAKNKNDNLYIGKLIYSVTLIKLGLCLILIGILLGIKFITQMSDLDFFFYLIYIIAYFINAFLPDYYYRGIEQMKTITYRTIFIKTIFMLMTFIFIKNEADYIKLPVITLCGNVIAVLIMYVDMQKKYNIKLYRASYQEVFLHFKQTTPFFVSRIASTVYQVMNVIVLSLIYGQSPITGYYTSADKIVSLSKTASSPIADSLYPYMLREKNFKGIKKFLLIVMPIIIFLGIIVYVFAEKICVVLFGEEYAMAGDILRCLLPIMIVILPTYVLCFPVMTPLNLTKYANRSNVVGMFIQIIALLILFCINCLNVYTLCIVASLSEVSVFLYRLFVVLRYYYKNKTKDSLMN